MEARNAQFNSMCTYRQFITFPPPDEAPCNLWVEISDKKHIIHGRLSADAVVQYKAYVLVLSFYQGSGFNEAGRTPCVAWV